MYTANGFRVYALTLFSYCLFGGVLGYFDPAAPYEQLGPMLASLNIFAFVLCAFLVFKGIYFPSSSDNGRTGSIV